MDAITKFREGMAVLDSTSLRHRPRADVQITIGSVLAENFQAMSASDRDAVWQGLAGSSTAKKLLSLSGYLAEVAIDNRNPELIRVGLILHAIENFQQDDRENIRYLALIAYAARKLGVTLGPVIASLSGLASERAGTRLKGFADREFEPNLLMSMGIKADDTQGAFRFVPAPPIR